MKSGTVQGQCKRLPLPSWPEAVVKRHQSPACRQASSRPQLLCQHCCPQRLHPHIYAPRCGAGMQYKPSASSPQHVWAVQARGLQGVAKTTHPFVRVHVGSQAQLTSVKWSTLGPSWEGEPLTFK